jgi:protein Mpv17
MMFIRSLERKFARNIAVIKKMSASTKTTSPNSNASLWERYNNQLHVNPIPTKCITAALIAFVADIVCQTYFPSDEKLKEKPPLERIDWQRNFNFTLLNAVGIPPLTHYWYGYLSTRIVGDTFAAALRRVFFDQALFAPFLIGSLFSSNMALKGEVDGIPDKLRNDLPGTMLSNYIVWIPAQILNFRYVPPQLRVLWANFVGFFWNIYLSSAANKPNQVLEEVAKEITAERE